MRHLKYLIAGLFLAAPATGGEVLVPQVALDWRSSSDSAIELSNEIEDLYLALYNSGNLNVRTVEIGNPPYVETLLRREGVMHGAHFPVALDAMLCDLNPKICDRRRKPVRGDRLYDLTEHVGGYVPGRGEWATRVGVSVTIPDYEFSKTTTLARIPAPKGWSPESYETPEGVDCSDWKMPCEELVKQFNPKLLKTKGSGTMVTVPQLRLETTILMRRDDVSEYSRQLEQILGTSSLVQEEQMFNTLESASEIWSDNLTKKSPTDMTLQAIGRNLRPIGKVEKYGVGDEPMVAEQIDLFKLINHPFARLEDLGAGHARPVDVLVIDSPITTGHCDLPMLKAEDGTALETPVAAPVDPADGVVVADASGAQGLSVECDKIDQLALSDADHTAGVAGVIGSKENGKGIVGINPHARLLVMGLDRNRLADDQVTSLVRRIKIDVPTGVRVANLSFGVRPLLANPADFREAMAVQGSRFLVVTAAGNEGLAMNSTNCPILPACLNELDNVITVVGLNNDQDNPSLWQSQNAKSNSSPTFDIGAPAENVLTTISDNRFARRTGTSFAAPQVTATASLIFAAGEFVYGDELGGGQLAPKVVKDRLLYTADYFSSLSGKLSAGRLNVGRAINLRDAQFELFDGRRIVGQVVESPDEFVCRTPVEGQQFRKWFNVRRIGWNEAKRRHFLFLHGKEGLGKRDGELERDPSCLIKTLSAPVEVLVRRSDGSSEVEKFTFKDIRSYTSPLYDE